MVEESNLRRTMDSAINKANGALPEPLRRKLDSESIENIRNQVSMWDERARKLFHERPIAAVAGAVVLGYVFGRMFSRRWL